MAGMFDGVEVTLGRRCGDHYPVLRGLAPGDRVVTAGAFLLDAETRLNPALAASYFGAGSRPTRPTPGRRPPTVGRREADRPAEGLPGDRRAARVDGGAGQAHGRRPGGVHLLQGVRGRGPVPTPKKYLAKVPK